jgi:hypothetical protein
MLKHHPDEAAKEDPAADLAPAQAFLNLTCGACGFQCSSSKDLASHMETHTKDRKYHCTVCGLTFTTQLRMESHARRIHNSVRNFNCDACSKSFVNKVHLRNHKVRVHTVWDPKTLVCKHCGKQTGTPTSLAAHLKLHSTSRQMSYCKICNEKLSCPMSLRRHMKLIHLKPLNSAASISEEKCQVDPEADDIFL